LHRKRLRKMPEKMVTVRNALGLHARAAARLVRLAAQFRCNVALTRIDNNVMADAKSILSVLTLAAAKGSELKLTTKGDDADRALEEIDGLFHAGFGEL